MRRQSRQHIGALLPGCCWRPGRNSLRPILWNMLSDRHGHAPAGSRGNDSQREATGSETENNELHETRSDSLGEAVRVIEGTRTKHNGTIIDGPNAYWLTPAYDLDE